MQPRRLLLLTLIAVLAGLSLWQLRPMDSSPPAADSTTLPLAMLTDPGDAPDRGCDDVVFVQHPAQRTTDSLTAALDTLFALDRDSVGDARHFLNRTNETLAFDHATVVGDTARIFLTGRLTGLRGVCDNPRARIQIEETAKRVSGVDELVLFRNGRRTSLQPDGRGER